MKKEIGMIGIVMLVLIVSVGVGSASGTCGDVNRDGNLNILDVIVMVNYLDAPTSDKWAADVNGDGSVNVLDIILIVNNLGSPELLTCCDKKEYYNSVPLTNNYEVLQYVKYCDDTNENEYVPGSYECFNFATDLVEVLRSKNVPAYYLRSINVVSAGHVSVLIDFPNELPMVIEPQTDADETNIYDTDNDGVVEYAPELNYVNPYLAYWYIVYTTDGQMSVFYSNREPPAWITDDGDIVADMNYC